MQSSPSHPRNFKLISKFSYMRPVFPDYLSVSYDYDRMKNSIIQALLSHSPSRNVNDKGVNSSPISKEAENDNLNNLDNLFDKPLMIVLLTIKRMIMKRLQIVVNLQNIKMLQLERKRKGKRKIILKNQITETTIIITNMTKTVITTELTTIIEVRHHLIQKKLFLFWVIVWSIK